MAESGLWVYDYLREYSADTRFSPVSECPPSDDAPENILLVVIDALRADYVNPELTPFLHEHRVADAVTAATWTFPSVSSLLTGRYPHEHGAMRTSDSADAGGGDGIRLPPRLETETGSLTERLSGAGYRTRGYFGFEMPFQALGGQFDSHRLRGDKTAQGLVPEAVADMSADDGHTFSYVHLADLHEPIEIPEKYLEEYGVDTTIPQYNTWDYTDETDITGRCAEYVANRKQVYRAAMAYVDNVLKSSLEPLIERDDTAIVMTSDHGEAFWEHAQLDKQLFSDPRPSYGTGHGITPYESVSRVPLSIVGIEGAVPGFRPSLVDIAPTIFDLVGLSHDGCTGVSLLRGEPHRDVFCEATRYGHEKKAIYRGQWKLIRSHGDDSTLVTDTEREEIVEQPNPELLQSLSEGLPMWPDGSGGDRAVSSTTEKRLEALGYK